jgi:hypothetical protein
MLFHVSVLGYYVVFKSVRKDSIPSMKLKTQFKDVNN